MTHFKVSDEVIEAALSAMRVTELAVFGETKTPDNGARREAIKAAIEAALPVMFGDPVAWQQNTNPATDWRGPNWRECTKEEHEFILTNGYWRDHSADPMNWPATTRELYAIKESK